MHVLINGSELLGVLPADALILMRLQQAEHLFPFGQQLGLVVLRLRQRADVDTGLLKQSVVFAARLHQHAKRQRHQAGKLLVAQTAALLLVQRIRHLLKAGKRAVVVLHVNQFGHVQVLTNQRVQANILRAAAFLLLDQRRALHHLAISGMQALRAALHRLTPKRKRF